MKTLLLGATCALAVLASPVLAADYAILGPDCAKSAAQAPVAREVIAKAKAALDRPPGAIPKLHTEGTLPGKGIREISLKAKEDQPIVLSLALAWRLTGDRAYLDQAGRYLEAWAEIYEPSFNPIDETGFDTLLMAYDLTEADLPAETRAKVDKLWRGMAAGYLDAMDAKPKNFETNWQSHRVKLAAMAAFQTGDAKLIARARAAFRAQITANLRADGTVFDFHERDAIHYVTYDLDPLMMAALSARAHGEDWFAWKACASSSSIRIGAGRPGRRGARRRRSRWRCAARRPTTRPRRQAFAPDVVVVAADSPDRDTHRQPGRGQPRQSAPGGDVRRPLRARPRRRGGAGRGGGLCGRRPGAGRVRSSSTWP
jgi:hypothetical protein